MCLNLEYRFSIFLLTSLSGTNKLCPPGIFFMICRSIFSFSRIAMPESKRMGGRVASKLERKSGGGRFMSTVVIFRDIFCSSARRYKSMKYSWQNKHAPLRRPSMVDAFTISSISGILLEFSSILSLNKYMIILLSSGTHPRAIEAVAQKSTPLTNLFSTM
uniref:Uncharacterized protein n=1 Tax=Lepeophtheirus salmonis TaxID=72036 RepID=A0A0K2UDK4_LEPSM